ncbi:hypothetical protein [Streptomyces nanshensis]|uniref:Uncharacterized protein n=1 Tax=Streptomyces nanshensis TaxID=518642 RepID=A0A1E7LCW9_9ACTN|nr:hypothetical protein [Streptomyces nanshensis]OEV14072.1 hypothetical protein AN218_00945 [Streptomyces nanshensis]
MASNNRTGPTTSSRLSPRSIRSLVAATYDGVPVVLEDDGDWLLTHNEPRARAALDRFYREHFDRTLDAHWDGHVPQPRRGWLRPVGDPDHPWRETTADHPEAYPALYIGD